MERHPKVLARELDDAKLSLLPTGGREGHRGNKVELVNLMPVKLIPKVHFTAGRPK